MGGFFFFFFLKQTPPETNSQNGHVEAWALLLYMAGLYWAGLSRLLGRNLSTPVLESLNPHLFLEPLEHHLETNLWMRGLSHIPTVEPHILHTWSIPPERGFLSYSR